MTDTPRRKLPTFEQVTEWVAAVEGGLPAIPPAYAMCHSGICSQDACVQCQRIIRAHNGLQQLLRWRSPE